MYTYHRCRCVPCSAASNAYYEATARLTRRYAWSPAEPARRRLIILRDSGLSVPAIAALCNVSPPLLRNLIRHPKKGPVTRVRQSMLDALNAISYRDTTRVPPGTYVDAAQCRRQLQSLSAAGWSMSAVSQEAGVSKGSLSRIINGAGAREATRARIDAAYATLQFTAPPAGSPHDRSAVSAARARAASNGWTVHEDEDFAYEGYEGFEDEEAA